MLKRTVVCLVGVTAGTCIFGQTRPTWTPISMTTKLDFPTSPLGSGAGRATEGGSPPFSYSIPSSYGSTVDSGTCSNYPSYPEISINGSATTAAIYRGPQRGDVSSSNSSITGIDVKGAFLSSGSYNEVLFFHESLCYIGGREYGFERQSGGSTVQFYVANNANCFTYNTSDTACSYDSGSTWVTSIRDNYPSGISLPGVNSQGNYKYYYSAFVFYDSNDGKYKFKISIQDPGTFTYVFDQPWCPPNVPQSDMQALASATGYITTVLQSGSPDSSNPGGSLVIDGVWIGR